MRRILFSVICFTTFTLGQHQELTNKFVNDLSECFMSIDKSTGDDSLVSMVKNCFVALVDKYKSEIKDAMGPEHSKSFTRDILVKTATKNVHCNYIFMKHHFLIYKPSKDSLDVAFENWDIDKVVVSENPIDIKTGNFISETDKFKIKRTLEKQFESIHDIDNELEFSIKWLNDFEYELTYLGSLSGYDFLKIESKFHVRVEKIYDDEYTYLIKGDYYPLDKVKRDINTKID